MQEIDGSSISKPPQISEMFQKFALAFKTKTFEFFAEEEEEEAAVEDSDGFTLLDSAEEIITDQKVVVIKPDPLSNLSPPLKPALTVPEHLIKNDTVKLDRTQSLPLPRKQLGPKLDSTQIRTINSEMNHVLISSIFATISSFEASYLQLQTAHDPFNEVSVKAADRALVSQLQKLTDFKRFYKDSSSKPDIESNWPVGSCLESQVQENQSKLRTLGTVSDRLQSEIDQRDSEVSSLRKKLNEIQNSNSKLSKKLSGNVTPSSDQVLLSVRVFDSVYHDAFRETRKYVKILTELMMKAGWDMDLAANWVHPDIEYAKKGHNRYALLSYVCLKMFRGFDLERFGHVGESDENDKHLGKNDIFLKQLLQHVSTNPMQLLSKERNSDFLEFCERKYQELIHPTMESSIFTNLDQNEVVLKSWRSLSVFYESFVKMASSIWTLHKLAFSFDPVGEIFQVEKGADFSIVYMEDVTRRFTSSAKTSKTKVGFTVFPGFKLERTVIQSQVYLHGLKSTEECL